MSDFSMDLSGMSGQQCIPSPIHRWRDISKTESDIIVPVFGRVHSKPWLSSSYVHRINKYKYRLSFQRIPFEFKISHFGIKTLLWFPAGMPEGRNFIKHDTQHSLCVLFHSKDFLPLSVDCSTAFNLEFTKHQSEP